MTLDAMRDGVTDQRTMAPPTGKAVQHALRAADASWRRRVLEDFANAIDLNQFRRRYGGSFSLEGTNEGKLRHLQDKLRGVWGTSDELTDARADSLVQKWFAWKPGGDRRIIYQMVVRRRMGTVFVEPNPYHFGVSLAWGIVEAEPRLAKCRNPECPAPYFLRNRAKKQYCDRKACASYGQRQHKLKWWEEHKTEQLAKRKAKHRRKAPAKKTQQKGGKYVFPHAEGFTKPDPTQPMTGWRSAWRSIRKAAGLPGLRFHDARHHAITELAEG